MKLSLNAYDIRDVAEVLAKEKFHALPVVEEHSGTILGWDCNNH